MNNLNNNLEENNNSYENNNLQENKSYFFYFPLIVTFFYNIREFLKYNSSSYINCLLHCNNVIGLVYESNIKFEPDYSNYEDAVNESRYALNELNSLIYNLPSTVNNYNKLNDSLTTLQKLLNTLVIKLGIILKEKNKYKDIDMYSRPDNFYYKIIDVDANNMNLKSYINIFDMY